MILIILIIKLFLDNAILGFHLGFSAKLISWEVPACKMRPQSGYEGRKKTCTTVPGKFVYRISKIVQINIFLYPQYPLNRLV